MSLDNEPDRQDVVLKVLLAGEVFTPPNLEEVKKCHREILRTYGIEITRSDFAILDHCQIGSSTISIGRYVLDYETGGVDERKRIYLEGIVTVDSDVLGNTNIRISSKADPLRPILEMYSANESLIGDDIRSE